MLGAVLPLLNVRARVPLCGLIAQYNLDKLPPGPDRTPQLLLTVLRQRVRVQGFIVFDHAAPHARLPQRHECVAAGGAG